LTGSEPTITTYTVTRDDLKGPFVEQSPPSLEQQATLPALGYRSVEEELAERFHASPALLKQLNPRVGIVEGREIRVPAVTPFNSDIKPPTDPAAADVTILVSRHDSALRATRADGTIIFYAPVTAGSLHNPPPTGDYKVLGLRWLPAFHYSPFLFWDAKAAAPVAVTGVPPATRLRVPIDGISIESFKGGFSELRGKRRHEAADIIAPRGTPIHAVQDGTIAKLFLSQRGGTTIYQFDAERRRCYYYAHLERYTDGLHEGQQISQGEVIGYVGTSGNAPPDTPHLHFAIFELDADGKWWHGRPLDPYLVFREQD
jgi:peptidoglycan LD-endopeptidase LytH